MPSSERVISAEQARHFQAWHAREIHNPQGVPRGLELLRRQEQLATGQAAGLAGERVDPVQAALKRMAEEREALDLRIAALRDWEQRLQEREQALDIRESSLQQQEADARQQGMETGQQEGYAAGWSDAENERSQWMQLQDALTGELETLKSQLAEQCLALGVDIARKVLMDSIAVTPDSAVNILRKVHEEVIDDLEKMTLFVHPDQLERFRTQLPDLPHFAGARLIADATLDINGFRIQHSEGGLDCSLQKRWQRVLSAMDANAAQEVPAP